MDFGFFEGVFEIFGFEGVVSGRNGDGVESIGLSDEYLILIVLSD